MMIRNEFSSTFPYLLAWQASDMTDVDALYIYIGNPTVEAGYVRGAWYFHNGTTWVMGGTAVDPYLRTAGSAADAAAAGSAIRGTEYGTESPGGTWHSGALDQVTGNVTPSSTRIRSGHIRIGNISRISCEAGYKFAVYVYEENGEGYNYQGVYNGTGLNNTEFWFYDSLWLGDLDRTYYIRIILAATDDSVIVVSDSDNVSAYHATDKGLGHEGIAADAGTVGEKFKNYFRLDAADERLIPPELPQGRPLDDTRTDENLINYDDLKTPGNYRIASSSDAGATINCPTSVAHRLVVFTIHGANGGENQSKFQMVFDNTGRVFYRSFYPGSTSNPQQAFWRNWKELACAAEISSLDSSLSANNRGDMITRGLAGTGQMYLTDAAVWEQGGINTENGQLYNTDCLIRTDRLYIPAGVRLLFAGIRTDVGGVARICRASCYRGNNEHLGSVDLHENMQPQNLPPATEFVRLTYGYESEPRNVITTDSASDCAVIIMNNSELRRTGRYTIKQPFHATPYGNENIHQAFPALTRLGDDEIICYRAAQGHHAPSVNSYWGGLVLNRIKPNGDIVYASGGNVPKVLKCTDLVNDLQSDENYGELRDMGLCPAPDGKNLILSAWTTYYTGQNRDADSVSQTTAHKNIVTIIDGETLLPAMTTDRQSNQVINTRVVFEPTDDNHSLKLEGQPIIAPNGHFICAAYITGRVAIIKTDPAGNPWVDNTGPEPVLNYINDLTWTAVNIYSRDEYVLTTDTEMVEGKKYYQKVGETYTQWTGTAGEWNTELYETANLVNNFFYISESSLGFCDYNGSSYLYCLCRNTDKTSETVEEKERNSCTVLFKKDLHNTKNSNTADWPLDPSGVRPGVNTFVYEDLYVHMPKLLPYWHGRYMPFCGAKYVFDSRVRRPIIGYIDVTDNSIAGYAVIDDCTYYYGSYCGFTHVYDQVFDVVYYDEGTNTSGGPGSARLNRDTCLYYKRVNMRDLIPDMANWGI